MMKAVKCRNCGKRLFDIAEVGKIETKCSKCERIVTIDILLDYSGKIRIIQKIA